MPAKRGRGGARPGSGPKPQGPLPLNVPVSIRMTSEDVALARRLGNGIVGAGIRLALDEAAQRRAYAVAEERADYAAQAEPE